MKSKIIAGFAIFGLLSAPAIAQAATVLATYGHADGWVSATVPGTYYHAVWDDKTDGHSVYSEWRSTSGGTLSRIETFGGNGTYSSHNLTSLYSFDVCENIPLFPDICSSFVRP